MLLTKEVEITIRPNNIEYYKNLGYIFENIGDKIIIKTTDLQHGSGKQVEVLCDYCKKEITKMMYKDYLVRIKNSGDYACINCRPIKTRNLNILKYGVPYTSSLEEIKMKIQNTNLERYGAKCSLQNDKIRKKAIETCQKHYGVDYSFRSKEVFEKTRNTLFKNYGVYNPSQANEIKEKISNSFYINSSQKVSSQQKYLNEIYGGILNYPIKRYNADIYLPENNIIIEYDGGGHFLNVITQKISIEEFNQKEIVRNNIIKREGYKQIRIISSKDYLPSDEILLKMLEQAKEYFNTTNHTWVDYNIDTFLMRNAEHTEGVYFNFGELRKIKKVS